VDAGICSASAGVMFVFQHSEQPVLRVTATRIELPENHRSRSEPWFLELYHILNQVQQLLEVVSMW
jgi:hypothetical protein